MNRPWTTSHNAAHSFLISKQKGKPRTGSGNPIENA